MSLKRIYLWREIRRYRICY